VTEQDGSAPTERPGSESSGERVVIRDRRKIDPTGGTRSKSNESGRQGRPDSSARSGSGRESGGGRETADREPGATEPAAGVADAGAKTEDDSGAAVRQAGRGKPKETRAEPEGTRAAADPAGAESEVDGEESTEATVRESTGLDEGSAEAAETDEAVGDVADLGPLGAELEALRAELDERIRDLQRITAEYANYRKRVDRDRGLVAEQATGAVLSALLPVLDDLDRAREHGDLVGPFGAVAEQLSGTLAKFGLSAFGEKGDPFDPMQHEAVAHLTSAEVSEPTCVDVMRRGYLLGDRLLRPALVAVADPE
jgi:molecular chaperone GrpE